MDLVVSRASLDFLLLFEDGLEQLVFPDFESFADLFSGQVEAGVSFSLLSGLRIDLRAVIFSNDDQRSLWRAESLAIDCDGLTVGLRIPKAAKRSRLAEVERPIRFPVPGDVERLKDQVLR